jgi:copper chaperone CopZ
MDTTTRSATVNLKVEGMRCQGCVRAVTCALSGIPGVSEVSVDLATGRATLRKTEQVSLDDLVAAVEQAGYHAAAD